MNKKLHILIFSKDRALQLDSLLRSIHDNFAVPYCSITILYMCSNEMYRRGYATLKQSTDFCANINWVEQQNFREDLCTVLDGYAQDSLLLFLVDDNIFFRPFTNEQVIEQLKGNVLFANLIFFRNPEKDMWLHVRQKDMVVSYTWIKRSKKNVYHCYPFSLDAHIYRVSVLRPIIRRIEFKAPNSLEGALHRCARSIGVMLYWKAIAPANVVAFNNPLNSVQLEGSTWNKGISTETLNENYLDGYRINNAELYKAEPDSMHFYHPVTLTTK